MKLLIFLILAAIIGFAVYVRFAPLAVAQWHKIPAAKPLGDHDEDGGFMAVRRTTAPAADVLNAARDVALATDRTQLVAGSVEEGMLTFQTRSKLFGFPDYTTIRVEGDMLTIYGRLRFGQNDLGVNASRVREWLAVLGPLTAPL